MTLIPSDQVVPAADLKRSTLWSFVLHASVKVSAVLVALLAVRAVSVTEYGLLLSMQAFVLVGVALWDFGVAIRVTRDVAAGTPAFTALGDALWARAHLLPLPVLVSGAMWAALLRGRSDAVLLTGISLATMVAFGVGLLLIGLLQGQHRYLAASVPEVVGRSASVLWVVYVVATGRDDLGLIWGGLAVCELVTVAGLVWALRSSWPEVRRVRSWRTTQRLVRVALPYAAASVFIMLYSKFDVNIVRFGGGAFTAGLYGPASRLQDVFSLIPVVLWTAVVPIAATHASDVSELRRLERRMTTTGLAVAIPAAAVVVVGADVLVDLVLGSEYEATVTAVRILALSLPLIAVTSGQVAILVALDRGAVTTVIYAVAFAVAAVAQFFLSRHYGVAGAAWGALCREPTLFVGSLLALRSAHARVGAAGP